MHSVIHIALNDLRIFFASRGNVIGLLVLPIGFTLLVGFFFPRGRDAGLIVDVIDHDDSQVSTGLVNALRAANTSLVLCPMDNDAENICNVEDDTALDRAWATARVENATSLAMIEIPAGFGTKVQALEPVEILYLSDQGFTAPGFIRQAIDAAILRVNGAAVASRVGTDVAIDLIESIEGKSLGGDQRTELSQAVYDRAATIWGNTPVRVDYESTALEGDSAPEMATTPGGLGQSVPGMGSMFVMFTVFGGMVVLVGERKQWTLQRLAVTPVSRGHLLGGKILGRFTLGFIQYLVVFAVGVLAGVHFGGDILALVLIMVSFTLATTALSFAVGSRVKSEMQAGSLTQLLVLVLAALGGAWWPLEIVPPFMRAIGHISPVAWAMDGYQSLIFENGDLSTVLPSILVLLGVAIVCFGISIWYFDYE